MSVNIMNTSEECPIHHIAFIMDGNGRWAKKRGMPREYGHKIGARAFEKIVEHCEKRGIEAATFYVFSTENWKRSEKEVSSLMNLLEDYLDKCEEQFLKKEKDIRFVFLGDKGHFSETLRNKMIKIEKLSKSNKKIINLAINYGGRSELVTAYNALMQKGVTDVTENDIAEVLYTKDSPELDMIIRTGGDIRISNFLLWQAAYAELYFTDKLWPDFNEKDMDEAIEEFCRRQRRFGGVKESLC